MDNYDQDTGKFCFGVKDTLYALESGAIQTLIVWENLDINRYTIRNNTTGEEKVLHLTKDQEQDSSHFHDPDTGVELEVVECISFLEWLANHYTDFGAQLEFITNRSQEGSQFVKGFGGIGGMYFLFKHYNVLINNNI